MTMYELDSQLLEAAEEGDLAKVDELLRRGADPNARDVINRATPLLLAAAKGYLPVARLLVSHGAAVNSFAGDAPTAPIEAAAIAGHELIVEWLLQVGAVLPTEDRLDVLVKEARESGDEKMVALLQKPKTDGGS